MPEVLSTTKRVCASVNVGTTAAGINMDAIARLGARVLVDTAQRTRKTMTASAAPSSMIFANAPSDNPFMAGCLSRGRRA